MARIFTIDFEFRGANHSAIVSAWKGETQLEIFQISFYDEALNHLAPNGSIRFSAADINLIQKETVQDELVLCLKKAVSRYLQKIPQ